MKQTVFPLFVFLVKSPTYLHELLSPQNLPNIALVLVGIGGIIVAICTLKAINHQAVEMRWQRLEIRKQRHEMRRQRTVMNDQLGTMQGQLGQMKGAGQQTERVIENASKQVEIMGTSGTHTEQLAAQAARQTELIQAQLELEHRPWIAVDVIANSPIVFDDRGCSLTCKFTLTNVGHSVAKNVSLWTDFAILGVDNPTEVRDRLSDIMKQPQNEKSDYGWLLFPNQKAVEHRGVIAIPERIQKALDIHIFQGHPTWIGFHLVGCVDYPSPLNPKKRHQTSFVYNISYIERNTGNLKGGFDRTIRVHDNITFLPTLHGASGD